MVFWFFVITLMASAILAILFPLARSPEAGLESDSAGQQHDREVYLDQLAELQRERDEGRIAGEEAEAARAEIARRLIGTQSDGEKAGQSGNSRLRTRFAALVALAFIPLGTLVIYSQNGSPHLPPQPLAARVTAPAADQDIRLLVARAEKHLADNPNDGNGWEVLGPVYMRMERPGEAARAFGNAIRLLGPTSERQANLGEAILASAGGIVTQEARQAFERASELDARNVKARFYLAIAQEQDGDLAAATDSFRKLLADTPVDAPWRSFVEQALARADGGNAPGPTREQVAAAGDMSDEDRQAMIETMVAGLAEKLEDNPADPQGWVRLVRAYLVLERRDDAIRAAGEALKSLEEPERKDVRMAFETMGITAEETGNQ